MKPVRIFRHIDCEGPGYLLDVLLAEGVPYELVCIDKGESVPESLEDVAGLVFMGGSMSVNDDLPWIQDELRLIQKADTLGMPVLGHCLGGQLIARALGGDVVSNSVREIGWFEVNATQGRAAATWLDGLPSAMKVFHWHGEMFTLPEGAELIMENAFCPHQAFVKNNMLAMQCHIEMTVELVQEWVARFSDQMQEKIPSVQPPDEVLADLERNVENLNHYADRIYRRWLSVVKAQF